MSRMPWAISLWPGLPHLLRQGTWPSLAVALGFAGLLNVGLAGSLVWSELLPSGARTGVWMAILAIWGGSLLFPSRENRRSHGASPTQRADTFLEAVDHYLKGNWFEAERTLVDLLRRQPRDVEAGLMLATLWRHTGRLDEADRQLDRLERLDSAAGWTWEIRQERRRITQHRSQRAEEAARVLNEAGDSREKRAAQVVRAA